jgi:hypothetical protein
MITIANLADALPIIVKDEAVFEQIKTDFPGILADLVTFKNNPNCTCRGRVLKFFTEQLEANSNVLEKYVRDAVSLQEELDKITAQKVLNNYAGKVFEVPRGEGMSSDEAWLQFSQSLVGKSFRNFSVVERPDAVVVYFL